MTEQQTDSTMTQAWQEAVQQGVKTRPWLAALLLQKGQQIFSRFAHYYQHLRATPRKVRRQLGAGQVVPGDGRGGLACDAGAYEFASNQTPTAVSLQSLTAVSQQGGLAALAAILLTALSGVWLWARWRGTADHMA